MSEELWVEYKTAKETFKSKVSIEGCVDVDDFIKKIRKEPQLGIPKDFKVTLCTPSGMAIEINESSSSLLPGNSFTNPHHVQVSAPLPVSVKPAPDMELTKFWDSLHGMEPENGFLKFYDGLDLLPETMKELYIRKAYEDLFRIICNNLDSENESKKQFHRMAITGTPGTGKSMFLFYILWRLANMKTTKTVILRRQMNHERIYVFQNDGCWIASYGTDIQMFLNDPTTWYLTDDLEPPPDVVEAITILVSSPAKKSYSKFLRYSYAPPLHYLPIWSIEELKLAAKSYLKSPEEVEKRLNLIGGIPRNVLEKNEDLEGLIKEAIGEMSLDRLILIGRGEETPEDQIGHRIVHFDVEPPCYTRRSMIMASEYVKNKVLEKYIGSREEELKHFLATCKRMTFMTSVCGNLFEAYAHKKLSTGGEFLVRSLDEDREWKMKLSPTKLKIFSFLSECKESDTYYRPLNDNYAGIDSLILDVGYFQVTMSLDHGITTESIKKIKRVLKMGKFYFVVPSTSYREFKKQRCIGGATNKEKEVVEQYALSISLEPNFALWLSGIDSERNPKVLTQAREMIE
jgi:hypothetical protein